MLPSSFSQHYIFNRRNISSPSHAFSCIILKARKRNNSSDIFYSFIRKGNKYELWIDEIFSSHHFSSSSPNFILIGFSKFIGAPFLSILLVRQRSLTSRSLGNSKRTFTWRGREPALFSPLSDILRWRDSFYLFQIYSYLFMELESTRRSFFWYRGVTH